MSLYQRYKKTIFTMGIVAGAVTGFVATGVGLIGAGYEAADAFAWGVMGLTGGAGIGMGLGVLGAKLYDYCMGDQLAPVAPQEDAFVPQAIQIIIHPAPPPEQKSLTTASSIARSLSDSEASRSKVVGPVSPSRSYNHSPARDDRLEELSDSGDAVTVINAEQKSPAPLSNKLLSRVMEEIGNERIDDEFHRSHHRQASHLYSRRQQNSTPTQDIEDPSVIPGSVPSL